MIIDSLNNREKYYSVHPAFKAAFESLASYDPSDGRDRRDIDGGKCFYFVQRYLNKRREDCRFEFHKKYIDIQYIVSGREQIDVYNAAKLECTENRFDGDDIAFYNNPDCYTTALLEAGDCVVLFTGEAHRPGVAVNNKPSDVVKIVVKVLAGY